MKHNITRKKTTIFSLLIIIIISIIISIAIWMNISKHTNLNTTTQLSEFATFQTLIISFWGLVFNIFLVKIAYDASKNFGVKEQYHSKQLSLVTELATDISSTIISNMMYRVVKDPKGTEHRVVDGYTFSFFEISLAFDYQKFDLMCVKTNNIENKFPFLKYRRNPVLPPKIAEKLNKLYRPLQYSTVIEKSVIPKNWVVFEPVIRDNNNYSNTWLFKLYDNPTDFSRDCLEIRESIVNWFKDYGADDINM